MSAFIKAIGAVGAGFAYLWGWFVLPWYMIRRRKLLREWTTWLERRAKRSGSQLKIVGDNAVMLDASRFENGKLTVSWVFCDRHGLTHQLTARSFDIPSEAFAAYRSWSAFYLADGRRACWWNPPRNIPEVPHV
ncbi:MAG: hypothetical protein GC134_05820 [Proteobacteria bacterium]|nr:hypothetical protein [Pseudomonadota bacterium]